MNKKAASVLVRGTSYKLMAFNRSLELCARMNHETENLDFIDGIKTGEVFFDLGACEGRFSIYAAFKGLSCFSFEPEKMNYDTLLENIELNKANYSGNITPLNIGVGSHQHESIIHIGQPWAGGHQKIIENKECRSDLDFNFIEKQKVKVTSIDQLIKDNKIPCPDYLKIDIDGSEIAFLEGASKTLRNPKVKKIIFELCNTDSNYNKAISLLNNYGFQIENKFSIPNESYLFNFIFNRSNKN
jgi:FkbM family methyltransferase